MKYRLINLETKEEHLCDKVTIKGFDYYKFLIKNTEQIVADYVVATNNPSIDLPQIIDEVEMLAKFFYRDNPTDKKGADYKYNTDIHAPKKRKAFIKGYNKHAETHPFSEEDADAYADAVMSGCLLRAKEWKEQQPKTIYYK